MAVPQDDRLSERDTQIWHQYAVLSWTQYKIAECHDISQSEVSRILKKVREQIPQQTRDEIVTARIEMLRAVTEAVIPKALTGDKDAVSSLMQLQAREAKLLGYDAPEKQDVKNDVTVRYVVEGLDD